MTAECFFDTNILLYAFSNSSDEKVMRKTIIARKYMVDKNFAVSGQVLMEFYQNATKKAHLNISIENAASYVEFLAQKFCVAIDAKIALQAISYANHFTISHWDGAIIAASKSQDIAIVYSEDLNHNQLYDGVRVINPFI